jgi:hypothetical protein
MKVQHKGIMLYEERYFYIIMLLGGFKGNEVTIVLQET